MKREEVMTAGWMRQGVKRAIKERTEGRTSDEDLRNKQKEENCAIENREREKVEAERGDRETERSKSVLTRLPLNFTN